MLHCTRKKEEGSPKVLPLYLAILHTKSPDSPRGKSDFEKAQKSASGKTKSSCVPTGFSKSGDSYFVSYRDPNLLKTVKVYEEAAEYIRNFTGDERTMNQYIIGAISDLDVPLTPQAKGIRSLSAYMTNQTIEDLQQERDQLLAADEATIRGLAKYIDSFLEEDSICVVGTQSKIKENEELFYKVENLF